MTRIFLGCLFTAALHPIAVEYQLDRPLDFKLGWRFLRGDEIYLQHQCSPATAAHHQRHAMDYIAAMREKLGTSSGTEALQMRLHANAQVYRNRMKFSREREAHYNATLNILTSHCGASNTTIEQQLILYLLRDEPLRTWQRVFIAEVLPGNGKRTFFSDSGKAKTAPLAPVMLSNHTPAKADRALLARLAAYLQKNGKLEEFALALARDRSFDDTGTEMLEKITGEPVAALQVKFADKPPVTGRNNTLRKLKR